MSNRRQHAASSNIVTLLPTIIVVAALLFVGNEIREALPHLHVSNPVSSTPAHGTGQVDAGSYKVQSVIPCGNLSLVDVLAGSSVSSSANVLGVSVGWLGANVDLLYPVEFPACASSGLPTKANVATKNGKTTVTLSVAEYTPLPSHIDDLSPVVCDGLKPGDSISQVNTIIANDFNNPPSTCPAFNMEPLGSTQNSIQNVLHLSRELAAISSDLAPLPATLERKIVQGAEDLSLPALTKQYQREYPKAMVKFATYKVEPGFQQMLSDWKTFGPEIRNDFSKTVFSQDGSLTELTVSTKSGTVGNVFVGQRLTKGQIKQLNRQRIVPRPSSRYLYAGVL